MRYHIRFGQAGILGFDRLHISQELSEITERETGERRIEITLLFSHISWDSKNKWVYFHEDRGLLQQKFWRPFVFINIVGCSFILSCIVSAGTELHKIN